MKSCYNKNQKKESKNMRVGMGYDVHQLVEGRDLILGGVNIPYEKGLLGHSDADVLLHAITDAILWGSSIRRYRKAIFQTQTLHIIMQTA